MRWAGKRYDGVRVWKGKAKGAEPGVFIVVWACNGTNLSGNLDAAVGMMPHDKFPTTVSTISPLYLHENFYPTTYMKLSEEERAKLSEWVTE